MMALNLFSGVGAGAPFADVEELLDFEESAALHARGVDLDPTELPVADGPVGETTSKFFKRTAGNRSVISLLEKELKRWLIQRNVKKME